MVICIFNVLLVNIIIVLTAGKKIAEVRGFKFFFKYQIRNCVFFKHLLPQ